MRIETKWTEACLSFWTKHEDAARHSEAWAALAGNRFFSTLPLFIGVTPSYRAGGFYKKQCFMETVQGLGFRFTGFGGLWWFIAYRAQVFMAVRCGR